jgi:pyrroloquinoline quinone (PQQ) biosynthesis protein C
MSQTLTATAGKLHVSERVEGRVRAGELTPTQVEEFRDFLDEVDRDLLRHRALTDNAYTRWFQQGRASDAELKHFIRQFSVFSNQFLVAALLKVINAPSLGQMRQGKEILLNELGVIYRKRDQAVGARAALAEADKDREGDPELVSTEGTVDGGTFRFQAAHFEWLLKMGEGLGFTFDDLGKRRHGTPSTLHFCDELQRTYGSDDPQFAEGASFAVENWAAAGFWQELEDGLFAIKNARHPHLKLAFFTWHNRVEAQHAGHTMEELEGAYFEPDFDRQKFLRGGRQILEGVSVFWDGLERDRINKVYV